MQHTIILNIVPYKILQLRSLNLLVLLDQPLKVVEVFMATVLLLFSFKKSIQYISIFSLFSYVCKLIIGSLA